VISGSSLPRCGSSWEHKIREITDAAPELALLHR
jgi:hypothetical protein